MQIGMKIYYEKQTGNVIVNTGERTGDVIPTTEEQDVATYFILKEHAPETVGMIQFKYGEFTADYAEGGVITRIDLDTLEPLVTYSKQTEIKTPLEPVQRSVNKWNFWRRTTRS
ncbi:hypothetical protein M3629_13315 [Paenibacillus polysaccharolyticus]|uniref:hypothetical protein n=1 Tax=Paenibacillus polysaccharolyticus TaxID=582692 RepID=UPI00203C9195|nr:hypothetical protein [Paenibacillus polysaccharolyticus]MCM3133767.1 hypothetical protein [Paenibacillus polysaccharolyticus]